MAHSYSSGFELGSGFVIAYILAMTLSTFPSTTVSEKLNAIAAIAADVYGPTPGSICSSFKLVGNTPSKSVTIIRAHFRRFRALA